MALLIHPRGRQRASLPLAINRQNSVGASLIGLVRGGAGAPRELASQRVLTGSTPVAAWGDVASPIASATGVYTARREFPDWEPTALPFSFIAYWYNTAYATGTAAFAGNTSGSNGYLLQEQFGTGNRRYAAGGLAVAPGATWAQNVPISSVLTYDGANLGTYYQGVSDGTAGGGAAVAYDSFTRLTFGDNPDLSTWNGAGGVWYFALANRIVTQAEALSLYLNPWQLFAPLPRRMWFDVTDNLFAQACL